MNVGETLKRRLMPFEELFNLKYPAEAAEDPAQLFLFSKFRITAVTTEDHKMNVWNGTHPVEGNSVEHICQAGTKVLVWMVSRFGDVGITDNLVDAHGYDVRIDPSKLVYWQVTRERS